MMSKPIRLGAPEEYSELIGRFDTFMLDCDGVIWHGNTLVPGAKEVLTYLRSQQKQIIFVTNNATQSRRDYKKKFDKLGIQAEVEEVFGSAYASAVYLSTVVKIPRDKKVYVIGMGGLEAELAEEEISFTGGTDPADNTTAPFSLSNYTHDPNIAAVLCGLDTAINYTKLSKALQYLNRNPGCLFLATNDDPTYPVQPGVSLPGAGAISAPLRYAWGKDPVSIGKPNATMLDCIKAKQNFDPARTIMVGDRLDTDIQFGKNGGISTLLVLTGVTVESDVSGPSPSPIVPDYVLHSLGDLSVLS